MDEPRLFETHGPVVRMTTTADRRPDGWTIHINYYREGSFGEWVRETYTGLSVGEMSDVLTAVTLS